MKLGEAQDLFGKLLGELLVYIYLKGHTARIGDVMSRATDVNVNGKLTHKKNSQHLKKLAVDINLFKGGKFLRKTEDHKIFGEFWENLHPNCRWGGRYKDGNHYEIMENGWR